MQIRTDQLTYDLDDLRGLYLENDNELILLIKEKIVTLTGHSVRQALAQMKELDVRTREITSADQTND